VGDALLEAGVDLDVRRVDEGQALPQDLCGFAGVVVMGGDMSATSDEGFPSRGAELALLQEAVAQRVPVLAVCLGAQLLAAAGGGVAVRGRDGLEVGWLPVTLAPAAAEDPLFADLPSQLEMLSWHEDTFSLPPGATLLATGERYRYQAFRLGPSAWGLQFHIEVDVAAVGAWLDALEDEASAVPGGGAWLRKATAISAPRLRPHREQLLRRFAALVAGGTT
jgi:GMP synthase-like glutamine amidotransferase